MFFLFLRFCPWLLAILGAAISWWQWQVPALYPWPLLMVLSVYVLVCVALLWRARQWREGLVCLLPTFTALVAIGLGHLFVETMGLRLVTTALFTFLPWFALELAWFMLYDSTHYPARAFSRLNLALVPISLWYVLATLQEIHVFLPLVANWMLAVACLVMVVVLFAGTVHTWNEKRELRWMWGSILIGLHLVALMLLLPTSLEVHGALGALFITIPLRLRYLGRERAMKWTQAAIEGGVLLVIWIAILMTSSWS